MVYADFEACAKPMSGHTSEYTNQYQLDTLISIKSINHVGSAIIPSASMIEPVIYWAKSEDEDVARIFV